MRARAFLALSLALILGTACASQVQVEPTVVFLVRHAERAEDGTNDPPISEAGQERARQVAALLADAGITRIHSTDYKRTIQTGTPMAELLGLEIESYDPRDLDGFAARLKASPGRHLVLGHSNTTPQLAEALGGESHGPIDEFEYDRLYLVEVRADGAVTTVLLRFGEPFGG